MRIKRDPRSHGDSHVFFLYDSAKVLGLKMALLSLLWHFRGGQEDKEDLERTPTIDDTYDYRPQPNKDDTHLITSSKVTPTISSDIPIHLSLPVQLTLCQLSWLLAHRWHLFLKRYLLRSGAYRRDHFGPNPPLGRFLH